MHHRSKKIPAFSLLEVALALIIMGIVATLTLPLLTSSQRFSRHKVTQTHTTQLFYVLAGYVLKYGMLPAPSLPTLEGRSIDYGDEMPKMNGGIIPYKELGLPEAVARDGYGNWFTYVVTPNLIKPAKKEQNFAENMVVGDGFQQQYCQKDKPKNPIILKSIAGESVLNELNTKNDYVAFILIGHGPHGSGAFHPLKNERLPVPGGNDSENENLNEDNIFVARMNDDSEPNFKHEVYWVTRNNLMAIYGQCPCQPKLNKFHKNATNLKEEAPPSQEKAPVQKPSDPFEFPSNDGNLF